jgi:hypothetical protein
MQIGCVFSLKDKRTEDREEHEDFLAIFAAFCLTLRASFRCAGARFRAPLFALNKG